MSKSIDVEANNRCTIIGTLFDLNLKEGKSKTGKTYRNGTATIRVNQHFNGKDEISDIPVKFVALKFKSDGVTPNPAYENIGTMAQTFKTVQRFGATDATRVRLSGNFGPRIEENIWADPRNPERVISNWELSCNYFNEAKRGDDCATFDVTIYILSKERELNAAGEETGRLKIRGGIVRYGRRLDCVDFFVEAPAAIDYIDRNWEVNNTVQAIGRVRYSTEEITLHSENSWGEDIPKTTTKRKAELIITTSVGADGEGAPFEDELAYAPEDIRILANDRTNRKEQAKIDAAQRSKSKSTAAAGGGSKTEPSYDWDE